MKISDLLRMSLESLWKRKVRTILTVLGVLVGTTSIVVMMSLGIGMKQSLLEEMSSYASMTMISVQQGGRYGNDDSSSDEEKFLDAALVETLSGLEHVEVVVPKLETSAILKNGKYMCWANVVGVDAQGMQKLDIKLGEGELPQQGELAFVYGNMILQDFFNEKTGSYEYWENGTMPDIDLMKDQIFVIFDTDRYSSAGGTDENGQIIPKPKKYIVPTAGVVAGGTEEWNQHSYSIYCDMDALESVLKKTYKNRTIPGQPTRKNGKPYKEIFYSEINVYVEDMSYVTEVQQIINDMGYSTYAEAEWINQEMQTMNIIQAVLGGIGAVSLFVAAIGITNTMMMSIYERTKEIGIMKVIGCRIRDIQMLFLIEAGYIGFLGGVLGVGLSYLLSTVANTIIGGLEGMGISKISVIPPWLALVSIVFAIGVGMISGLVPSVRAMRLSPLAAIRSE